jgi:sterol desaturase/sphingolipid hydroxylase (fatty acid hydroxylase superfamily)
MSGVTETEFQLVRGIGFAAALGVALVLQRLLPYGAGPGSWRTNGALWLVNGVTLGLVCGGCACTAARWAAATGVGALHVAAAPMWVAVPVTIAALDLVSYGWHRANHRMPWLWRFHRVHHSDLAFTTSTALRFHPGELLLSLPIRLVAIILLGPPVVAIVAFEIAFTLANLMEHGDIRLPRALERRLGAFVVTPALHRHHHRRDGAPLASNFGTVFVAWDRLLGTYAASSSAHREPTGVPEISADLAPGAALALPFRRA